MNKVTDDRLRVTLDAPDMSKVKACKLKYFIPKIVPGTYALYDFGKFVYDFKALDKNGKELKVKQEDKNTWTEIEHMERLLLEGLIVGFIDEGSVQFLVDFLLESLFCRPFTASLSPSNACMTS